MQLLLGPNIMVHLCCHMTMQH